jgi:hypothetical protein
MLGGPIGAIGGQENPAEEEGLHSHAPRPAFPGVCAEASGGAGAFRGQGLRTWAGREGGSILGIRQACVAHNRCAPGAGAVLKTRG